MTATRRRRPCRRGRQLLLPGWSWWRPKCRRPSRQRGSCAPRHRVVLLMGAASPLSPPTARSLRMSSGHGPVAGARRRLARRLDSSPSTLPLPRILLPATRHPRFHHRRRRRSSRCGGALPCSRSAYRRAPTGVLCCRSVFVTSTCPSASRMTSAERRCRGSKRSCDLGGASRRSRRTIEFFRDRRNVSVGFPLTDVFCTRAKIRANWTSVLKCSRGWCRCLASGVPPTTVCGRGDTAPSRSSRSTVVCLRAFVLRAVSRTSCGRRAAAFLQTAGILAQFAAYSPIFLLPQ